MTYKEALELKQKSQSLIGTKNEKGFVIKDIIIVPADKEKRKEYINNYILDSKIGCDDFSQESEVYLWAVDTAYLRNANILFFEDLTQKD